jgi:TatD DNase family protein
MQFIDTHAHLYLEHFNNDYHDVIQRALKQGITKILLPNIDTKSVHIMNQLVSKYPQTCFPMMGLHPTSVKANYKDELEVIFREIKSGNYVAIGETGIDLYWDKTFLKEQCIVFEQEIKLALELNKPLVIHARQSFDVIFEILEKYRNKNLKGVFHAFSGNLQQALHAIQLGFMLGIGGMLTYKNSGLDYVVQQTGLEHIVVETDAPFLPPVPHRGERNEPAFLIHVAEKISAFKSADINEVARITTENAQKLFYL